MTKTLLEKAKGLKSGYEKGLSDEQYELGMAWVRGEISLTQIRDAMEFTNMGSTYGIVCKCFSRYYRETVNK